MYQSFSNSPMDISFPKSAFQVLARLLFVPTGITAVMLNDCHGLFSINALRMGLSHRLNSKSDKKYNSFHGAFPGSCKTGQIVSKFWR